MTHVTLITRHSCASCEQAKAALARLAREYPLDIHEVPLETPEGRALATKHGVAFAPGVLVDGDLFSYGRLPEKKLRLRLARSAAAPA